MEKIEERKDNGRSKLIFCHYHMEIDKMVTRLNRMGLRTEKFDGRTSQAYREEILTSGEIDALGKAKAVLSGADYSLVQTSSVHLHGSQ